MAFKEDYAWQEKYLNAIKCIVGPLLLEPAPLEVDMAEATDMLILRAKDMRIGCRVRRADYVGFKHQFTLRSKRDNGATTELAKVIDGWGDWLFYGFAEDNNLPALSYWHVIDLHAWRAHMIRDKRPIKRGEMPNGDGTHFMWFDVQSFPPNPPILIASNVFERALI